VFEVSNSKNLSVSVSRVDSSIQNLEFGD
jgi:hypothetical protein